jgi:hypothetical protein
MNEYSGGARNHAVASTAHPVMTNVLGNGPWFDGYIANLPPVPGVHGAPG